LTLGGPRDDSMMADGERIYDLRRVYWYVTVVKARQVGLWWLTKRWRTSAG